MNARKTYARRAGSNAGSAARQDVYQTVTDTIMAALEAGTVPWQTPWIAGAGRPMRMSANKPYQGVNVFLLAITAQARGYTSPWWGTYEQIQGLGAQVREGENKRNGRGATNVTLWKTFTPKDAEPDPDTGELAQRAMARMFPVFNAEQADGLPDRYYTDPATLVGASEDDAIPAAQAIIDGYVNVPGNPGLALDESARAWYLYTTDEIHMPPLTRHTRADLYYSTAFHEITHSTGHPKRLGRRKGTPEDDQARAFGSHAYGCEELCAEMGSAMLCATAGISTDNLIADHASYIASWLKTIKEDKRMVIQAASQATRAVALVLGESDQHGAHEDQAEGMAA